MKNKQLLANMILMATNAHKDQFDLAGQPYILHPLKVMHYLKTEDEQLQCIAVGHDLIEDCGITAEYLRIVFPSRVVDGIVALTKKPGQLYGDYLAQVCQNRDAVLVKLADIRHNSDIRRLKGISEKDIKRIEKYQKAYIILLATLHKV